MFPTGEHRAQNKKSRALQKNERDRKVLLTQFFPLRGQHFPRLFSDIWASKLLHPQKKLGMYGPKYALLGT